MPKGNRGGKRGQTASAYGQQGQNGAFTINASGTSFEMDVQMRGAGTDNNIPSAVRQVVVAWENKRVNNKIEYASAYRDDGTQIGTERKGSGTSVRAPTYMHDEGVFTHNHPTKGNVLGGSFSEADLTNFTRHAGNTIRATAKEGTYSVTKGSNFDGAGLMSYFRGEHKKHFTEYKNAFNKLTSDYHGGKITFEEYSKGADKAANTYLAKGHNALVDGQSKYGYYYVIEVR